MMRQEPIQVDYLLPKPQLISEVSLGHLVGYFWRTTSLFRTHQNAFLAQFGPAFRGHAIELGGEKRYDHGRFFPHVDRYTCSNIQGDVDRHLDITNLVEFEDESQDGFICISVLEHVLAADRALDEITRTLKPGGQLLLSLPFLFPFHDQVDYWRFARSFFERAFGDYEVHAFVHLGGKLSAIADLLQRPRASWKARHLVYKAAGWPILLLAKFFDTIDEAPAGYGIYAVKRDPKNGAAHE